MLVCLLRGETLINGIERVFWGLVGGIRLHWGGGQGNYPASQSQGMSEQERGMVAGLRTKETDGDGSLARVVAGG